MGGQRQGRPGARPGVDYKGLEVLRRPFPEDAVQLKAVYCGPYEMDPKTGESYVPEGAYGRCEVCGRSHDLPARHLRYVGHARITERLLEADPAWTWEPAALDASGLPLVRGGKLWIRLTACGVTRLGVGDAGGRTGGTAEKEMIGDAIRNAAMRFGCGLELWVRDGRDDADADASQGAAQRQETPPEAPARGSAGLARLELRQGATKAQAMLHGALCELACAGADAGEMLAAVEDEFGAPYDELSAKEVDCALEFIERFRPEGGEEALML